MEFNTRAANSSNNKSTGWNSTGGDRTSSNGASDDSVVNGGKSASPNIISTGGTASKTQSKRTRKGVTFSSGGATTANANAGRSAFGLHNSPVPVNGSVVSMPIVSVLDAGSIGTAAATAAGDCESGEYANGGDDDEFKRTGDTHTKSSSARDAGIGLNDCGLTTHGGSRLVAAPPMSAATVRIQCAGGVTTSPNSNISDNQLNDNINNVNIVEDKTKSNGTISNGSIGSGPLTPPTTTNADNLTRGQVKIASGNREQDYDVTKKGTKSKAANQMSVAGSDYNDFVNYLYDSGSDENQATAATPLLSTVPDGAEFCPKSIIVKSPSAVNIQGKHSKSLKPRLSLQPSEKNGEGSRGVRDFKPELHVQFVGNQPKNDIRTSSLRDLHVATAHSCTVDCELSCTKKLVCVSSQSFNSFSGSEGGDGGGGGASTSVGSSSSTTSSSSSNENSSEEGQFAEARPPDGGWGWVVVFASFMINLFSDGITFSFGVIYVEFLSYFGEGKAKTAWIGSLFMAMPLLSGPIASFLTDRYGCRNVTVAGSIMASIGFILSAFATSMEMLYVTFGILAGFGLSLCYVAAIVIVAYYFDKRRSFATGLSVCGSGIGTFIFAPLIQVLIEEYGWRGSVLILAGVFLNMGLCGLLMRDLEWTTYSRKKKNEKRSRKQKGKSEESNKARNTASDSLSLSTNTAGTAVNWNVIAAAGVGEVGGGLAQEGGTANATAAAIQGGGFGHVSDCISPPSATDHRLFSSLIVLPTFLKNGEKVPHEVLELLSTHRNFVLMNSYASMLHSRSFSEPIANDSNQEVVALEPPPPTTTTTTTENESVLNEIIRRNKLGHHNRRHHNRGLPMNRSHNDAFLNDMRMHRHSLTYRGAMLNINRYRLRASSCPDIYRNSMTTIAKEKNQLHQGWEDFRKLVVEILDLSPLLDVRFLLFAISNFLLYTWYDVPYVYIADYAISLNVSEKSASLILSIIGIVNMVGEIFLGWIGDKKNINVTLVYALCMILCGISVTVVPLFVTYEAIGTLSGLFGFFIAANYSLQSIILVQLITLERFTNAYGLLLLVQGVANLIGPPLAGYIRDVTGDYGISFYAAGVFIVISGLLLTILPAVDYYKKYVAASRQKDEQKISPKVRDPEGEPLEKV